MEKESPRGAGNWLKEGESFGNRDEREGAGGREVGRGRWRKLREEEEVGASQSVPSSQEYHILVPSPVALGILFVPNEGGFHPLPPFPIAILFLTLG